MQKYLLVQITEPFKGKGRSACCGTIRIGAALVSGIKSTGSAIGKGVDKAFGSSVPAPNLKPGRD